MIAGLAAELKMVGRLLKRLGMALSLAATNWRNVLGAEPRRLSAFKADLGSGFDAPGVELTLINASDILGGRVVPGSTLAQSVVGELELRSGDVVILRITASACSKPASAMRAAPKPDPLHIGDLNDGRNFSKQWQCRVHSADMGYEN